MTRGVPTLHDTARPLLSTRDTCAQHGYEIFPLQLTVRTSHSPTLIPLVLGQAHRDDKLPWMIGDCSDFSHYTCAGEVAARARSSQFWRRKGVKKFSFVEGVLRLKRWEQFVEGALRLKRWEQLRRSHFDLKKCGRGKKVFTNFLWNAHIGLEVYINNMSRIWCVLTAVQLKQSRINRILRNAQWSTME